MISNVCKYHVEWCYDWFCMLFHDIICIQKTNYFMNYILNPDMTQSIPRLYTQSRTYILNPEYTCTQSRNYILNPEHTHTQSRAYILNPDITYSISTLLTQFCTYILNNPDITYSIPNILVLNPALIYLIRNIFTQSRTYLYLIQLLNT